MPPSEFYVRLQHGIAGGFAPPTPSAVHVLSRAKDSPAYITITSAVRPDGTASLNEAAPKKIAVEHHTSLIEELHSILNGLPTEFPPGSEDIYGLDTSIAWGSDDLQWHNGGPAGCGGGNSNKQASAEDKKKFKRAVEIVNELVGQEL
ncbi:hypothetical protein K439DRAFT_1383746 [Ramaria rubella]|nr:hypothetical protein K439DRAFT_1383746 [Ramaria rubella]